jgi:uncharacterized protein
LVSRLRVASLHLYPIKGVRAVNVAEASVEPAGFADDRRWMIVDADGRFLSQREVPKLATLVAEPIVGGLRLPFGDVMAAASAAPEQSVTVWSSSVPATPAPPAINAALSDWLDQAATLVHMGRPGARQSNPAWAGPDVPVSFADAYPVLVATSASLAALNAAMATPVPMDRFRPNLVIDGADAWEEDRWTTLHIGDVCFDLVKPCDRCLVTTTDQTSGARMGKEPLATLAKLRRSADPRVNGVLFGWNAVPRSLGTVRVGDCVEATAGRPDGWPLG